MLTMFVKATMIMMIMMMMMRLLLNMFPSPLRKIPEHHDYSF